MPWSFVLKFIAPSGPVADCASGGRRVRRGRPIGFVLALVSLLAATAARAQDLDGGDCPDDDLPDVEWG
jgi:hypothetical protein